MITYPLALNFLAPTPSRRQTTMDTIGIAGYQGLWIMHILTPYGRMEVLCGEGDAPDLSIFLLVEQFFDGAVDHIAAIRRSAFGLPVFWRPIRLAVNDQGRLGLQFKSRLTGRQQGMFFADERSSFRTNLSSITATKNDADRLWKLCYNSERERS